MDFAKRGYFPGHDKNRMKQEGDVAAARDYFYTGKNKILTQLVKDRYTWMNRYITDRDRVILELGCGAGLSKSFIKHPGLVLTDVLENPWVDQYLDALDIEKGRYGNGSVDVFICSHMLHHLASPTLFLEQVARKLKPHGKIIIQDIYTGRLMKLVLRIMRHEGYWDGVDVFDREATCNQKGDPWSANCSIPKLLFSDKHKFEKQFPYFKIRKYSLNECFLFYLSGGVIAKTFYLPANKCGIRLIKKIDRRLIAWKPGIFAGGCSVVLEKTGDLPC